MHIGTWPPFYVFKYKHHYVSCADVKQFTAMCEDGNELSAHDWPGLAPETAVGGWPLFWPLYWLALPVIMLYRTWDRHSFRAMYREKGYECRVNKFLQGMRTQMDLADHVQVDFVALSSPCHDVCVIAVHQYWVHEDEFEMRLQAFDEVWYLSGIKMIRSWLSPLWLYESVCGRTRLMRRP